LGENTSVGDEAGCLQRKDESIRHIGRPFGKGLRPLRAVIGAVDLDDLQLPTGKIELILLLQIIWIEMSPPGFEGPSPDAGADYAGFRHSFLPIYPGQLFCRDDFLEWPALKQFLQELAGIGPFFPDDRLRRAGRDDLAAAVAAFRSEVQYPVRG